MQTRSFANVALAAALMTGFIAQVGAVEGSATFFTPGLGACGVYSGANDMVVAVNPKVYAKGKHCNERMKVQYKSKSIEVTVLDECPACNDTHIDLGESAFRKLADVDLGVITVTWDFVSESDSKDH